MKKDSVNASFCAFHNTSRVKTRREGRRRGDGERLEILIFMVFLRLPSASGRTIHRYSAQDLLHLGLLRTVGRTTLYTHFLEFYGKFVSPGIVRVARHRVYILLRFRGLPVALCPRWHYRTGCEQRSTPSRRISAPFVQAVSAKRAVDIPSTAESLNNRLTVVSLDR